MKKKLFIFLSLICLIGACANNEVVSQNVQPAGGRQAELSKEAAAELADKHLALRKWSWGKAKSVVEQDKEYYVYYETPEQEQRLIGARVLIVEKESGVVSVQKRR